VKHLIHFCWRVIAVLLVVGLIRCQETPNPVQGFVFEAFNPTVKYSLLTNFLHTEDHAVKQKQQFADMLMGYKISSKAWLRLNTLSRHEFDFRKIKVGQPYTLFIQPDSVCSLRAMAYEVSLTDYVIFHFGDSLELEYCQKEISTEEKRLRGTINNNLSETISNQGVSHELTNKMVDILGWQIDFYALQKGDSFTIAYEQKSVEGKPAGIETITGIYFHHGGKDLYAIPFDQGEGLDYFDQDGNSIRRAFLKYPIEFTHIASRYSLKRFHPVLKVYRPHLGTDLSAATGTPIRTVGDGTIVDIGYNGGSGNYVKVKHNATYTTGYLHMSKFATGMKRGTTVKQGQVIGYVGSTGWSTGPHLCYRFWKNGVQVDALKVQIPPAKPVRAERLDAFGCLKQETLLKLNGATYPPVFSIAMNE
jgi:murein DD-endopeptidase MepM/ murein hydrolase activator NlpD